jgi:hypothetical protein
VMSVTPREELDREREALMAEGRKLDLSLRVLTPVVILISLCAAAAVATPIFLLFLQWCLGT